ncbi:MAG: amidohydrolase [Epulopiscium sp.]|nr:amidohydrolase [Candidatus Epulonipiscium sp.]
MNLVIIDAHMHLWKELKGFVHGKKIRGLGGGVADFMGEKRQMMPPYLVDGANTAEIFISNMNYAGVAGAVVTQEYIDGIQNEYLMEVQRTYPEKFFVCGMPEFRQPGYLGEVKTLIKQGFKGIKIPAQRLIALPKRVFLNEPEMMEVFALMEREGMILSIDLAEGDKQVGEMEEIIQAHPALKIAIGHFGMVNRPGWKSQVKLARHKNVYIESGGITWLYHKEFYPYRGAVGAVKEAAAIVGMDKLMWGSDYPRTMTAITYKMSYDFFYNSSELTQEEKKKFLGENAINFYGFKNLQPIKRIKNMVED